MGIDMDVEKIWRICSNPFKENPVAFIFAIVIGCMITYLVLKEQIKGVKEKNQALKEQVNNLEGQVGRYKQVLGLELPADTSYSLLTNEELQKKTLGVVGEIRGFLKEIDRGLRPTFTMWERMDKAKTKEEKNKIWYEETTASSEQSTKDHAEYDARFKAETILLRDELWERLPKDVRTTERKFPLDYARPTNPIGMEWVSNDLERLAKALPFQEK